MKKFEENFNKNNFDRNGDRFNRNWNYDDYTNNNDNFDREKKNFRQSNVNIFLL